MTNRPTWRYVAFPSELGWMALLGDKTRLLRLVYGHASEVAALTALHATHTEDARLGVFQPSLIARLQDYARGRRVSFANVALDLDYLAPFQRRVMEACRAIPYGQTRSYGDLAAACGSPRAARAVGSTMAANRFPLIIPCHRVINSDGSIGNYSGWDGVRTKKRLLQLEQGQVRPAAGRAKPSPVRPKRAVRR